MSEFENVSSTDARPGLISSASAPNSGRVSEVWAETAESHSEEVARVSEPRPTPTVELGAAEARVLGALIEKSFLTPDVYPMTTNGMVTACNQKTNRDPVVDYSPVQIDSTLLELRQRNLVRRVHTPGSRSTKHRQTLDEALSLNPQELALVSVLLLRGPQTIGELRLRTERHDVGFDDLGAVDACLEALAARPTPLVRQLPRQPGHKENRWQHLLGDPEAAHVEAAATERSDQAGHTASPRATVARPAAHEGTAMADLTERVESLSTQVAVLQRQLAGLADKLGEPLE